MIAGLASCALPAAALSLSSVQLVSKAPKDSVGLRFGANTIR
jgi:hypothetical protein